MTNNTGFHVEGRRWFDRSGGNTYHSVRIFHESKEIAYIPFSYGYDDGFLQTAIDWLFDNKYITEKVYGTLYLRETLLSTYSVIDVPRKRDL